MHVPERLPAGMVGQGTIHTVSTRNAVATGGGVVEPPAPARADGGSASVEWPPRRSGGATDGMDPRRDALEDAGTTGER